MKDKLLKFLVGCVVYSLLLFAVDYLLSGWFSGAQSTTEMFWDAVTQGVGLSLMFTLFLKPITRGILIFFNGRRKTEEMEAKNKDMYEW